MAAGLLVLLHSSLAAVEAFKHGLTLDSSNVNDGTGAGADEYKLYAGDGSSCADWPSMNDWVSFEDM